MSQFWGPVHGMVLLLARIGGRKTLPAMPGRLHAPLPETHFRAAEWEPWSILVNPFGLGRCKRCLEGRTLPRLSGRTRLTEEILQMLRIEYDNGPIALQPEVISSGIDQVCLPADQRWRRFLIGPVRGRDPIGNHAADSAICDWIVRLRIPNKLVVVRRIVTIDRNPGRAYSSRLCAVQIVRETNLNCVAFSARSQMPGWLNLTAS